MDAVDVGPGGEDLVFGEHAGHAQAGEAPQRRVVQIDVVGDDDFDQIAVKEDVTIYGKVGGRGENQLGDSAGLFLHPDRVDVFVRAEGVLGKEQCGGVIERVVLD